MAVSRRSLEAMTSGGDGKKPPETPLTDTQLQQFGNFAGSSNLRDQALYLMKKGMKGAEQLYTDHPDISTRDKLINAQSDWKPAAISAMLIRARRAGLRTPTEINANKDALLGALRPELAQAINHPAFSQIHENFWPVFSQILQDRYSNESRSLPSVSDLVAKK